MDKLKNRLLGTAKTRKAKSGQPQAALINQDTRSGLLVSRMLKRFQLQTRLQDLLEQAGLKWHASRLLHTCLALLLAGFAVGWLMFPSDLRIGALLLGIVAGLFPILYVLRKRKARLRRFEELFPESLEFVARSMRAGHAFSVSLERIHPEFQEPLAGEVLRTLQGNNPPPPPPLAAPKKAPQKHPP